MCQPTTSSRAEYKILIWMLKNLLIINTQSFHFIWWQTKKASVFSFLILKNVHLSPPFRRCVETFVSLVGHKLESSPQRLDLPKTRKIPGFLRQKEFASPSQQMIPRQCSHSYCIYKKDKSKHKQKQKDKQKQSFFGPIHTFITFKTNDPSASASITMLETNGTARQGLSWQWWHCCQDTRSLMITWIYSFVLYDYHWAARK